MSAATTEPAKAGADAGYLAAPRAVRGALVARLRPHRRRLATAVALALAQTGLALAGPALVGVAIDRGVRTGDVRTLDLTALALLGVLLIVPVVTAARTRATAAVGERLLAKLRSDAFGALLRLELPRAERAGDAALLSRLTTDVDALAALLRDALPAVVGAALLAILTGAALLVLSPPLAVAALVWVPIVLLAGRRLRRETGLSYPAEREAEAAVVGTVGEDLAGVAELQAAGRTADRHRRLSQRTDVVVTAWERSTDARNRFFPVVTAASTGAAATVLAAGAALASRDAVSVGTVAAAVLYLARLIGPVSELLEWLDEIAAGQAALARVVGLIAAAPEPPPQVGAPEIPARGELVLDGVRFGYEPGDDVLHGVTLAIRAGERVALVGRTGAGKSTLALVVAGLVPPSAGRVAVGGVDLAAATAASVSDRVLLLAQEGALLGGTVADVVRVARPEADDAAVAAALARLGVDDRFSALPHGLATPVQGISAGEAELLALARIVLADPAVVVIDEATARLDPVTERAVESALHVALAGRAVLVIAHRTATALRADRVAVLADGQVVEEGEPAALRSTGGAFARLLADASTSPLRCCALL